MPILILQHSQDGGPGRLGLTLRDYGFGVDIRRADLPPTQASPGVPHDLDNIHGIVILGAEENVTDIARYPWMQAEANLIRMAHAAAVPLVGICMGAQLIAHALGGTVAPKSTPDCGFRMMNVTVPGQTETMMSGIAWRSPQLFFCSQEITQAAPGTQVLASTDTTKIAAYKVGLRTYGFICHFEYTRKRAAEMGVAACGSAHGALAQDMAAQLADNYDTYARLSNRICNNIAEYLFPESRRLVA